ncbi:MAG: tRNA (guanosine(46)-N7)-methyltransferase TrmB [Ruthenibacterium sp.]
MRLRFKAYAAPELAAWSQCERQPQDFCGHWAQRFARPQQPLHLELGCGKGGFLAQLAIENPHINYIGIDLTDKVLVLAKRKLESACAAAGCAADNVCIVAHDIERIREMLSAADAVQRVYINFCNPWDKKAGHTKHRLTHPRQLLQYRSFLAPGAELWFKCDDDALYTDALNDLPQAGFAVTWQTWDLHADEPAWNRRTEHEEMFAQKGLPTHALIARIAALPEAEGENAAR